MATDTLPGAIVRGSLGFAGVSLATFSIWAFGGKLFPGYPAMFAAIAAAFLVLTGLVLYPLAGGMARFYAAFVPAFVVYAAVWCVAWFALGFKGRDWVGSLAGSVAFAAVLGAILRRPGAVLKVSAVVFILHSAGYFLGYPVEAAFKGPPGQLGWGLTYGLGFGAGIGYAFHAFRPPPGPGGRSIIEDADAAR